MAYLGAARSLASTGTFRVPTASWADDDSTTSLSLWPPGYPAALAVPIAAGLPAIPAARVVNAVAAAITAATLFLLIASATSTGAGLIAVLVVFATPAVLDVHLSVLSEPFFITCVTLTLTAMTLARRRLLLLGALAALTVMTRYAGAAAPAAVVCWTFFDPHFARTTRFKRALLVAIIPTLTLAAWVLRTAAVNDRHGTPHLYFYGNWGGSLQQAATTFVRWAVPGIPDSITQVALAFVVLVASALILLATWRDTAPSRVRSPSSSRVADVLGASLWLAVWYVVVIALSRTFVGGTIPFDWRICAPLFVLLEVMIVVALAHWWRAHHTPVRAFIAVCGVCWLAGALWVSSEDASAAVTDGSDFAASEWRTSPTVAWVRANGSGHTLYSNWPPALYFHAGRIARELPDSTEVKRGLLPEFADAMRTSDGLLVGFTEVSPDVVRPDSIAAVLHLREVARFPDGVVWAAP